MIKSVLDFGTLKWFQLDAGGVFRSMEVLSRNLEGFLGVALIKIRKRMDSFGISRDEIDWVRSSFLRILGFVVENRMMPLHSESRSFLVRIWLGEKLLQSQIKAWNAENMKLFMETFGFSFIPNMNVQIIHSEELMEWTCSSKLGYGFSVNKKKAKEWRTEKNKRRNR